MTNIMLVAGDRTAKLSKFLVDRNTFDVTFQCSTIADSIGKIQTSIINIDKLVYIFQQDSMNIRTDMQLLKNLLTENNFFTVREIILMTTNDTDELNQMGISYFNAVMSECSYTNYSIKTIGDRKSFADIYDALLGVSHAVTFTNSYKEVYRVERHSDTKTSYVPNVDTDFKIEPFNYDKILQYNDSKSNAEKIESGIPYEGKANETFTTFENPNLGRIVVNSVLPKLKTELITGESKTGVSTWTCALAVSALKAGQTVTVLDFTTNCDIGEMLTSQDIPTNNLRMLNMLKSPTLAKDKVNVCTVFNEEEANVKLEFIQNLFTKTENWDGYMFIAFPIIDFGGIWKIIHNDVDTLFVGLNPLYSDTMRLQGFLSNYEDQVDVKVFLNDVLPLMQGMSYLEASDVRDILPFDNVNIIKPIKFKNVDVSDKLFKSLLEVQV